MTVYSSTSPEATRALGRNLSQRLAAGDVVLLQGDLGAGKTEFAKGIAEGFKVTERVTSPTFALLNIYQGILPIYHFDLYRLNRAEELYSTGFDEFLEAPGLTLVEWPDIFSAEMPEQYVRVKITNGVQLTERIIEIEWIGSRFAGRTEGSEMF
jgi:tRNA threonylcarbamoyladenosine biosynthesis protein TsaE